LHSRRDNSLGRRTIAVQFVAAIAGAFRFLSQTAAISLYWHSMVRIIGASIALPYPTRSRTKGLSLLRAIAVRFVIAHITRTFSSFSRDRALSLRPWFFVRIARATATALCFLPIHTLILCL
jgi:hypothetical protein